MYVDAHFHLGIVFPNFHFYDSSVESYLQYMDKHRITYCINAHTIGLISGDLETGMQEDLRAYELSGGRILSYLVFNPNREAESLRVMERYNDGTVFRAIKLHPSIHGVYADDPRYEAAWAFAEAHQLPIMSHTWEISSYNPSQKYSYPPLFEKYAAKYPGVPLICGHSGGRYDGIQQCVKLARQYENVYMDTSGDVYNNRLIEYLAGHAGAERVLFGSDGFLMDARSQIGLILDADISLDDKESILYRNAKKLFRLQ